MARHLINNTLKFTGKAASYAAHRPSYPASYIDYLWTLMNDTSSTPTIADIGSGTGILTRLLLDRGAHVYAVEPNSDMRCAAETQLATYPRFSSVDAAAEATGLAPASIDLITVAQAFHWFNPELFREECQRILKPTARIALVWNTRDSDHPLFQECYHILKKLCPTFQGFSGGIDDRPEMFSQFFAHGTFEKRTFENPLYLDLDGFIGRNVSASYAPLPDDPSYIPFVESLTALFHNYEEAGKILFPMATVSYVGSV